MEHWRFRDLAVEGISCGLLVTLGTLNPNQIVQQKVLASGQQTPTSKLASIGSLHRHWFAISVESWCSKVGTSTTFGACIHCALILFHRLYFIACVPPGSMTKPPPPLLTSPGQSVNFLSRLFPGRKPLLGITSLENPRPRSSSASKNPSAKPRKPFADTLPIPSPRAGRQIDPSSQGSGKQKSSRRPRVWKTTKEKNSRLVKEEQFHATALNNGDQLKRRNQRPSLPRAQCLRQHATKLAGAAKRQRPPAVISHRSGVNGAGKTTRHWQNSPISLPPGAAASSVCAAGPSAAAIEQLAIWASANGVKSSSKNPAPILHGVFDRMAAAKPRGADA